MARNNRFDLGGLYDTASPALDFDATQRYLNLKEHDIQNKAKFSNPFNGMPNALLAEGGDIHIKPSHRGRLTELKERTGKTEAELYNDGNPAHKKMVVFARNARKWKHADGGQMNVLNNDTPLFAFGGDMQTNGTDFSTGATHIDTGGSHEINPNDGVQMGVDPEGIPNLVEEGEVVFNDYVYSKRIELDEEVKKKFHFPKKTDITYADAAKKLEKEIKERPNDPISRASFKAQMEQLADEQERQKQEMEAERAKAAFEALSPEEQTALMQQKAQEEAMAQQAAQEHAIAEQQVMQQPTPEEAAMMQQQMQADGSQAMVGQEPEVMAEGGHLFPWGGIKEMFNVTPPYAASRTAGYIPYTRDLTEEEVLKKEQEQLFKDWTDYVNTNWETEEVQNYLKALDTAAGGNHLFDKNGKLLPGAKDYFNHARTKNHKWGYYHLTPQQIEEAEKAAETASTAPERVVGYSKIGQKEPMIVTKGEDETGKKTVITTPIPEETLAEKPVETPTEEVRGVIPAHLKEWPRYAGLFGPLAGLGLMAAGVGKPDASKMYAAANSAATPYLPRVTYIGDYEKYSPIDRLFHSNDLMGLSEMVYRGLSNTTNPSKTASQLAHGYNTMLALGKLRREGEEYNDALEHRVKTFNRETNLENMRAFNQNQRDRADALNRASSDIARLKFQAAANEMDANAGWFNSLYGNVAGVFKGLSDLGTENKNTNWRNAYMASGAGGVYDEQALVDAGIAKWKNKKTAAKGGKLKQKRGLTI